MYYKLLIFALTENTACRPGLITLMLACLITGCSSSQPAAEPVDVQKTVSELVSLQQTIQDYCQGNKEVNGHDALHKVGHHLGVLKNLDASSGLAESQRDEIAAAADTILTAYGDLDGAIHEGTEFDYDTIASTIDEAIANIQANIEPITP